MTPRTYDAIQMAAELCQCDVCGGWGYMTKPGPVCITCRQWAERILYLWRADANGGGLVYGMSTGCISGRAMAASATGFGMLIEAEQAKQKHI
jgi:hypothetical protein